jgi:hypothetical protein
MVEPVVEVVGVYDADGGVIGELSYAVGHLLGRTSCALCEVTHRGLHRRPEWDAMAAGLPVPVRLVHRDETTAPEREALVLSGLPAVLGVRRDGSLTALLGPTGIAAAAGSVEVLGSSLAAALATDGVA